MALTSFVVCEKGVTAIEYALVTVAISAVVLVVFNPTIGPFYDAMIAAKDAIVSVLEDST
ncbi:Flp family type IVb pilin [Marinomonas aquimarina]|uniref:Flp family type IVb pilin n=1 Tax=Marinomonas aquimarina TaxID=295068 RepID=UPI0009EF47A3|nr:Flp family type IVb pilin [Marinomonas aquimarina]